MPPTEPAGEADALLAAFARWSAGARLQDEVLARSRQRWLHQQAAEAATLTGTLVDLAEGQAPVRIGTRQRWFTGTLVGVGPDLCVLEEPERVTVIALTKVVMVQPLLVAGAPRWPVASGDRPVQLQMTFRDALSALAMEVAPVRMALASTEMMAGDLVGVGEDVLTLRVAGSPRRPAYIPLGAVEAFSPQ